MFSYRMFGMNFADIANLKKEKLHGGRLDYARQKTSKLFNFKLAENAQDSIDWFANEGRLCVSNLYDKALLALRFFLTLLHTQTP